MALTSIEKKVRDLIEDGVDLVLTKSDLTHEAVAIYHLVVVLMEVRDELRARKGV